MHKSQWAMICITVMVLILGCSKRTVPETNGKPVVNTSNSPKPAAKSSVVKRSSHVPTPKIIVVNDKAAKKNIDGRLYYDLEGHRYWRNYNDGKYYLFSQAMYGDSAFLPH